ncbi:MAG: D-aminoacylase [SAR202 cluster bacterium]|jgi:N-acyl-D-amino-acid deacylase|nr:D-aminoacylase [SAR202 cluster bacterium]
MTAILIKSSKIYDGTGAPPFVSDILIKDDRIESISNIEPTSDHLVIESNGLAASPGFIDTHTHSDGALLNNPQHAQSLRQGVTTEILGQDGLSYAPLSKSNYLLNRRYLSGILGLPPENLDMSSITAFRKNYDRKVSINTAYCIAHGAIRLETVGFEDRPLKASPLEKAKDLVRSGMEEGAVGLATGMSYFPNAWSDTEEIIELCSVVSEFGGVYVTHLRDKNIDRGFGGGGVTEAIEIARQSGVKLHFSHFRTDENTAGEVSKRIEEIDQAISEGMDISLELYPYPTGSTFPLSFFPSYAHEGGLEAVLEKLRTPVEKNRLANYLDNDYPRPIKDAIFSYVPGTPEYEGISLDRIATEKNVSLGTAICDILLENEGQVGYWGSPPLSVAVWEQINQDTMEFMSRPDYMIGSDSIPLGSYPHPRAYGTFPRVVGRFQRKYNTMPLEHTIQRITDNPARRFGLKQRGRIQEGYFADIVLFDPDTINDNATYDDPKQFPTGIPYVIVNGEIAVSMEQCTGTKSGKAIP